MKKLLLVAAIAVIATSCKKQYDCDCSVTSTTTIFGVTGSPQTTNTSGKTDKLSKSDAKSKCEASNGTTTSGDSQNNIKTTISCSIK